MKRLTLLKSLLIERINPERYFADVLGEDIAKWSLGSELNIYCPIHNPEWKTRKGKSPSFALNKNGKFKCHSPSCGARGVSLVNFHEQFNRYSFKKTLRTLYHSYIHPIIPPKIVEEWHKVLLDSPSVLRYLTRKRGLEVSTIRQFKIGFDGIRITIPIPNEFGMWVNARRYDFTGHLGPKMISYRKKDSPHRYGEARFFPIDNLYASRGSVLLCEGEWDCLVAIQEGYTAVTSTDGADSWPKGTDELWQGKSVRIVYDVNDVNSKGVRTDAGQIAAKKIAQRLAPIAKDVKVIQLPLKKEGGDISDYFVEEGRSKEALDQLIHDTPYFSVNKETKEAGLTPGSWIPVRLDEASKSKFYYVPIEMDCLVAGKNLSPFLPPKKIRLTGVNSETKSKDHLTLTVNTDNNKDILKLVNCTEAQLRSAIGEMFEVPDGDWKFDTLETFNMEELRLIPAIDLRDFGGSYVIRRAYHLGHGIEANRVYRMRGYTIPDPKTQHAVHILTEATPIQDNIENFKMTPEALKALRDKFSPKGSVSEHIYDLAAWLSRNVTKIKRRPDLHIAIDLVFHSVLSFKFNGEEVRKGWLELMVLGDTRCGKGYVAEGLSNFYRLGEVVTGENCTFAGLIGGLQQNDKHWMITWGKVPLNDKRLVIIDETSAMSTDDIGRMSRVRSEGVAEIVKIQSEKTRARTRLIWLSNARSGRPLNTYGNGVEAILELMGSVEDVSRFDFAMTVATAEVPSRIINTTAKESTDAEAYSREDFTNLVLWGWSRTPDQIQFSEEATTLILELAIKMGRKYSPTIPLVQAENIRIKLARLSAAVAVRCFSTQDGETLQIRRKHVLFAYEFLTSLYGKPSMGYDSFSYTDIDRNHLKDEKAVVDLIKSMGKYGLDFVEGMLGQREIGINDMSDFTSSDKFDSKELIGKLVRLRCLAKEEGYYIKRPPFIEILRDVREKMMRHEM